jgi:hypothetical protein
MHGIYHDAATSAAATTCTTSTLYSLLDASTAEGISPLRHISLLSFDLIQAASQNSDITDMFPAIETPDQLFSL